MTDRELERVLSPLRDGPVSLPAGAELVQVRERVLPTLRGQVREVPERLRRARRARVLTAAALASGAISAAAAGFWSFTGPLAPEASALRVEPLGATPFTLRDGGAPARSFAAPATLPARGVLSSGDVSAARVTTAQGVRIELAERTEVDLSLLADNSEKSTLRLMRGAVECRVPRLSPGRRFTVVTDQVEVIVHGTVFSVRAGAAGSTKTCVRVSEGRVTVRHPHGSAELSPGQAFGCEPDPAETAASPGAVADTPVVRAPEERVRPPRSERRRTTELRGTLHQENLLLSRGLSAERAGRCDEANQALGELLARYPESPLTPEARAGLARCRASQPQPSRTR